MLRSTRLWPLLVCAILLLFPLMSSPALGEGGGTTIDTSALSLPVREIRDVVPYRKDDAHFGIVGKPPDGILEPPSTPIQVRLRATKAPRVNEAINVALQVHAFADAPGTTAEILLPEAAQVLGGTTTATFDLAAGQTEELTATIVFTQVGEHTVLGRALKTVSPEMVWGDQDGLYLTVGEDAGFVGFLSGQQPRLSAGPAEEGLLSEDLLDEEALLEEQGLLDAETLPDEEGLLTEQPNPEGAELPPEAQESLTPAATVKISICWRLGSDRDGSKPRLRDARVELWDRDSGADDRLAWGYTNYRNGCKTFTVSNADTDVGGKIDVYVKVRLWHSGRYRVTTYGGGIYYCQTSTQYNVSADYNYGRWGCGGRSGNDRSVRIYNDLYRALRFVREHAIRRGMGGYPGEVKVLWETGGTDGTYYSGGDKKVHLADADAESRDTVVHEANHSYMDHMYVGWPLNDCPSPHYISGVSGWGCALSEGWTYAVVAAADGNPVYTWPSGATLNLETPNCKSAGWDDGPKVEGRVGGVLIDLMDPFKISYGTATGFSNEGKAAGCSGRDNASGMFDAIWDLFYDQDDKVFVKGGGSSNSFSNAWEARQYPRYAPHLVGHHNTIPTFTHD